ncbi:MAG: hypothetical protein GXO03_00825 [Aquificae bacterium]|nr:hypothetical protein [Aquificota bacterium]
MKVALLHAGKGAPGTNAFVLRLYELLSDNGHELLLVPEGFKGLTEGTFTRPDAGLLKRLRNEPLPVLKPAPYEGFKKLESRERAYRVLKKEGVDALVVLGGRGATEASLLIAEESGTPVLTVPFTVEADLSLTDEHGGFSSFTEELFARLNALVRRARSSGGRYLFKLGLNAPRALLKAAVAAGVDGLHLPGRTSVEKLKRLESFVLASLGSPPLELPFTAVEQGDYGLIYARVTARDLELAVLFARVVFESLVAGESSGFVAVERRRFYLEQFERVLKEPPLENELLKEL